MLSFNEFVAQPEPITESLEDHLTEEELVALDEALGNLSSLGAGKLLNAFKQWGNIGPKGGSTSGDQKNFSSSSAIGDTSEIKDIGQITSWKDIRKEVNAAGKKGETGAAGVVIYLDGRAYATANFQHSVDKIGLNDTFVVAVDDSILPDAVASRVKQTVEWNKSHWDKTNQTGGAVLARNLETVVDLVVAAAKVEGSRVTAKLILVNKAGIAKRWDRNAAKVTTDPLALRQKANWASDQNSLASALTKYKAGKRESFDSKTDASKILAAVVKRNGAEITVDGKLVTATAGAGWAGDKALARLLNGESVEVTLSGPGYKSVTIKFTLADLKAAL